MEHAVRLVDQDRGRGDLFEHPAVRDRGIESGRGRRSAERDDLLVAAKGTEQPRQKARLVAASQRGLIDMRIAIEIAKQPARVVSGLRGADQQKTARV